METYVMTHGGRERSHPPRAGRDLDGTEPELQLGIQPVLHHARRRLLPRRTVRCLRKGRFRYGHGRPHRHDRHHLRRSPGARAEDRHDPRGRITFVGALPQTLPKTFLKKGLWNPKNFSWEGIFAFRSDSALFNIKNSPREKLLREFEGAFPEKHPQKIKFTRGFRPETRPKGLSH